MIFFIMIETNKYVQIVLSCSCTELPCIYQIQWHYLSRTGIQRDRIFVTSICYNHAMAQNCLLSYFV